MGEVKRQNFRVRLLTTIGVLTTCALGTLTALSASGGQNPGKDPLSAQLADTLSRAGFTGRVQSQLETRLGRKIDKNLADTGRLLWFDTITGLNNDNTCGGCHSPSNGFGDTQSIAIGIDNNAVVGPHRNGPRNQRRSPMAMNAAFYPTLMWNSRFFSLSGDPFDNRQGFQFTDPEARSLSHMPHLLAAHAYMPPTERTEVAGFKFIGDNDAIRNAVVQRLNQNANYRTLFARSFPSVRAGGPISMDMLGEAIAEFEFTLVRADAPIDRFARGETQALTTDQKKGALLFFGKAGCVQCHAVSGRSNEMFSDFRQHNIGVPQIVPIHSNIVFDGPTGKEDFGLEQVTENARDRYLFRTSPLRNVALQPAFFHNGAFTRLEDAIRHHLDAASSARSYTFPADLAPDLTALPGPIEPVLARLDPLLKKPTALTADEFRQLVDFVRNGLLDPHAVPDQMRSLVPDKVPSGRPVLKFEFLKK